MLPFGRLTYAEAACASGKLADELAGRSASQLLDVGAVVGADHFAKVPSRAAIKSGR